MKILVACEESQAVTKELRRLGHEAYSCDIIKCSGGHPEWHIMQDVLPLLDGHCAFETMDGKSHSVYQRWDMIIAFPPCTYLSKAGACRLYPKKGQLNIERYNKGLEAKKFFMAFLNADCPRIAVENPVSIRVFEMPIHTQEIQPYQFDPDRIHPYTKKTRIWIRGDLTPLVPTTPEANPVGPYVPAMTSRNDPSKYGAAKRGEDAKHRAKTFPGIARAMAECWAGAIECHRDMLEHELEQVTRERDAAVSDLQKVCRVVSVCLYCKSRDVEYVSNDCMDCVNSCNWQWRGVEVEG